MKPIITAAAVSLVVFVVMVFGTLVTFGDQFERRTETQRAINIEQRERTVAVCHTLMRSNQNLARALRALIEMSDADAELKSEFSRRAGLDELDIPPEHCAKAAAPFHRTPEGDG